MCKSWCESILAVLILVFTYGIGAGWGDWSMWAVYILALVLLVHSFTCKTCFSHSMTMEKSSAKGRRK